MHPGQYPMTNPVQPAKKRRAGLIIAGIVGAVIMVCCGIGGIIAAVNGGDKDSANAGSPSSSAVAESSTTKKTDAKPTKQAAGLNTPVRDGKFEFVVSSVECGKPSVGEGFLEKNAQGQYCLVSLSVKNIGSKPQMFIDVNQKGFAAGGAQYAPDSAATIAVGGQQPTWLNNINPGNSISGKIVFDMPAGAKLTKLELHDSMLSGGVTVAVG